MARDFNENRNVNAILKSAKYNNTGVFYAFQKGADGITKIEIENLASVKALTGKNTTITSFSFYADQEQYGGIGAYSLSGLTNLKSIYIYQGNDNEPLDIDLNAFESNTSLEHIFVNPNLLSRYQTLYGSQIAYGTTTIGDLLGAYTLENEWEIPTDLDTAPTTLTKEFIRQKAHEVFVNENSEYDTNLTALVDTIIVPSYFTSIATDCFEELFDSVRTLGFGIANTLKLNGQKTISADFLYNCSMLEHFWLDNGNDTFNGVYNSLNNFPSNFRTLAPYLVFSNYFMSAYASYYPVIGYQFFSSGDTLPQTSPTGEYLWFSNIDFDTDYNTPTGLENDDSFIDNYEAYSSTIYYCYDKTEILVVQDDGTHILTSALVQSSINGLDTPTSWIKKVVVPNTFTSYSGSALSIIENYPSITSLSILMNFNLNLQYFIGIMNTTARSQILEFETNINFTFGRNEGNNFFDTFPNCEKYIMNGYFKSGTLGRTASNAKVKEFLTNNNSKIIGTFDSFMYGLSNLHTFGAFDMSEYVASAYIYTFAGCSRLTSILAYGWLNSFNITDTALDHDALVTLLNNLGTSSTQHTLTMGATKLALLSAEEQAIATNKNWVLV